MALASSGSRSSISSVEPLISANSAVTVLRSPSTFSGAALSRRTRTLSEVFNRPATECARDAPQESQNRASGRFSPPHDGHRGENRVPHLSQNLALSRLSAPHFEQRIFPFMGD